MNKRFWLAGMCVALSLKTFGQQTFPLNGVSEQKPEIYAFTNATIYTDYQTKIEKATLVVRKGKIEAIGTNISIPKGAMIMDLTGKTVYPSFVEMYSNYGMPEVKKGESVDWRFSLFRKSEGAFHANESIHPELDAERLFKTNDKSVSAWRNAGFGAMLSHQTDGIARGSAVLVTTSDKKEHENIIQNKAAAYYSFRRGNTSQSYPYSPMGSIALLRQTYLDASWHKKNPDAEKNISLDAWNSLQTLPQIFAVEDAYSAVRSDKVGDEFGVQYIIKGSGDEYQIIDQIKATNATFIIPLKNPSAPKVDNMFDANFANIADLKHWEMAILNPKILAENGVEFAFTTQGLDNPAELISQIRKAIAQGLDEKIALKALTYTPARLLKAENQIGSLKNGMLANFIISSSTIFSEENVIFENWVKGQRFVIKDMQATDIRGDYELKLGANTLKIKIKGETHTPAAEIESTDGYTYETNGWNINGESVSFLMSRSLKDTTQKKPKEFIRLSGWLKDKNLKGNAVWADGNGITWEATRKADFVEAKKDKKETITKVEYKPLYPFTAFGFAEKPKAQTVLFKNATVWTNENEGVLQNTDVLVKDGKIVQVGKNLASTGATVIDATGKHLTAGIIDEHTHIGIHGSVNEGVYSNSSEVRISDVINPKDINIYRQLSGGVVAAQQLHGSANAIGGQSSVIKFKWGTSAEDMKLKTAPPRIKFALGENVKNSNADDYNRFPQTRMGVEQVFVDAFTRAKEYEKARKENPDKVRQDLQLDAMVEILNGKRLISCHSYVQSEINMLMKVAERFGFKINVFTHILEGYKVADKMKAHGVHASSFADWWGYKYEVKDAIPHNAALMTKVGVMSAINSDDAEMARRLNQEAAKTIKYGNLSEEEALKTVTLNPAKMLRVDDRMGSIKVGKDADIVLWSDNPLSVYAKAEYTLIEGVIYFDRQTDLKKRTEIANEKNRIIQRIIAEGKGSGDGKKGGVGSSQEWHCDDIFDFWGE